MTAAAGTALLTPSAHADFTLLMRDLTGGSDGNPNNTTEAEAIIALGAPDATYAYTDYSDTRDTINVGDGNIGPADLLPNGNSKDETYVLQATANLIIPVGTWSIGFKSDDGGRLIIPGITFDSKNNENGSSAANEVRYEGTRGPNTTWGSFTVTGTPLETSIDALQFESGGGDGFQVVFASGNTSPGTLLEDTVNGWTVQVAPLTDSDPPVLVLPTDPADDATGVYPGATTLTATFDEDIAEKAGGTITLTDVTDGTDTRAITLPNAGVSVSANVLTIDLSALDGGLPTGNLEFATDYEVTIGGANNAGTDAIEDTWTPTANIFTGTNAGDWTFTTAAQNLTAPALAVGPFSPADDATLVVPSSDLSVTFDQDIVIGTGNIEIIDTGDASGNQTIAVTDASQVSVSGATLTISPTTPLEGTETYAIQIAAGAVKNYSDVDFAGILAPDVTTWNFETGGGRNLTWDPSGGGSSDGGGTWLDAGKWWDGSSNVTWENAFPDNATIGNGGGGNTITIGAITAGTVLFDNFSGTYKISGTSIDQSGGLTVGPTAGSQVKFESGAFITGTGGVTVNGGFLELNAGDNTLNDYSGDTIITNGGRINFERILSNPAPNTNIQINGGILSRYYQGTIRNTLGTGPGELQILGGESGFQGNSSFNIQLNNDPNSEIVWGSAFFQPSVLILASDNTNGSTRFQNPLDLNGADRTIRVNVNDGDGIGNGSFQDGRAEMIREIRNSLLDGNGGLVKVGSGNLWLNAANTYDGGTFVNEGGVRYRRADAMPSTGTHAFAAGVDLQVDIGGGDDFTLGAGTAAGSLGGLLAGNGPGTSTVTYAGDLLLRLRGSGTVLCDIPNVGGGTTDVWLLEGNTTFSGNNTFSGELGIGRRGGSARTLTLGSATALAGQPATVVVDTSGQSKLDLASFDATIGKLMTGSNNGGSRGQVVDTAGGGTLTLTDGVFSDDHNNGGGGIFVDTVDLNGAEQIFEVRDSGSFADNVGDFLITSVIQNGSLTMTGLESNASLRLEGVNTYTGETKVTAGIVSTNSANCLADASEVRLEGSGRMNLDFVGTDTIAELYLGGVAQGPGVYDNSTDPTYLTGTGSLTVAAVAGSPFDTWAALGSMGAVTFEGDTNGDGVQDGIAFLLGVANPDNDANGALPTATETAGGLVLTFDMLDSASRGTATLSVEHSSDLGDADAWTTVPVPDNDGGPTDFVTFVVPAAGGSPSVHSVTATIGAGAAGGGKLFGRLKATNPE